MLQYVNLTRSPARRASLRTFLHLDPAIMIEVNDIQRRLIELDVEHRDLDAVIDMLILDGHADQLQLRRLKKRKLQLKDHITLLKMQLVPDVPA
jgi:hypothetical protein